MAERRVVFENRLLPYLLVAPQLAVTVVFFLWPAFQALEQSFYLEDAFGFSRQYVEFRNYAELFADPRYLKSFWTTMVFGIAVTVLAMAIAQMAGMIEASMIAARIINVQLPLHAITTTICLVAGWLLIPRYELAGAVIALAICRFPFMLIGVLFLRQKLRAESPRWKQPITTLKERRSLNDSLEDTRRVA